MKKSISTSRESPRADALGISRRTLGRSGITVSELGIGCWAIGGPDWNLGLEMGWGGVDDRRSLAGLELAFDLGSNHFDTADIYGHGHSERLIGELLRRVPRDRVVVASKVGYFHGTAPNAYHPLHLRHQLEMTLSNLGTDYLDIFYLHNFHFGEDDKYLEGAVESLRAFKQEGKIRALGMRGPHRYAPDRYRAEVAFPDKYSRFFSVASLVQPDVIQVRYNMLCLSNRPKGSDLFDWAEETGVGVVINKPLAQGLLLDKYHPQRLPDFPPGDHRRRKRWFTPAGIQILHRRLRSLKEHFGSSTDDLARVALQYCLSRSSNACVLVGFKTPEQVEMNLRAAGKPLTNSEVERISRAMEGIGEELGDYFHKEAQDD